MTQETRNQYERQKNLIRKEQAELEERLIELENHLEQLELELSTEDRDAFYQERLAAMTPQQRQMHDLMCHAVEEIFFQPNPLFDALTANSKTEIDTPLRIRLPNSYSVKLPSTEWTHWHTTPPSLGEIIELRTNEHYLGSCIASQIFPANINETTYWRKVESK